jgi:hypothetical protein
VVILYKYLQWLCQIFHWDKAKKIMKLPWLTGLTGPAYRSNRPVNRSLPIDLACWFENLKPFGFLR